MDTPTYKTILAIESSCDETAAAVIENGTTILSSSIASSTLLHAKYGGIVPEVAAREQLDYILPTIIEALLPLSPTASEKKYLSIIQSRIDAIAITNGPGLIGSLLVGVETAKTLSFATKKPLIPVNHVLAHMYANFISSEKGYSSRETSIDNNVSIKFPAISLVVSGGHTELYLMKSMKDITWLGGTLDDAAGEAFDKTARLLGFENRGGPAIQDAALRYQAIKMDTHARLPRPMLDKENIYNFSFSGLKTAILRAVNTLKTTQQFTEKTIAQLAHEVQESITDVLVKKTLRAVLDHNATSILLSGGVAANLRLREKFTDAVTRESASIQLHIPPVSLCTDNAAYIGSYAYFRGIATDWHDITAIPDLSVEL